MRLASIYLEDHEYLFDAPQTINLGGKFFYDFSKEGDDVVVKRTENKNHIEGFFNLTQLDSKVTHLNAIVGQNGAGKSTLLNVIRSQFIRSEYALPQSKSLFLVEDDEQDEPIILRNDFDKIYLQENQEGVTRKELELPLGRSFQTIYYSPHFDYRYNPNFDDVDNHDLSFDRIVEDDLKELAEKDLNDHGTAYSASQELLFKNALRQIEFLSSDLVNEQKIFKDIFQLPQHYEPQLYFRGYRKREREWNTPYELRSIMKLIDEKLEKELDDWHTIRKLDRDRVTNQHEVNQYILKRNVIKCILSLLNQKMERNNQYLREGHFPMHELAQEIEKSDAYSTFLLFIKSSELKLGVGKKIFNYENVEKFLDRVYTAIEMAQDEDSVTNDTLKTSSENAIEILKLQRQFLNELSQYYYNFQSEKEGIIIPNDEKVEGFINYMPFSHRLSSGENSLLNFFSRIYNFLNSNLKEVKFRELKEHYILLLDEADLTFHATWKKRYVQAILKTLPYFFDELDKKPSLQIIFTTHDPLTLSDLPNSNVIYIEKKANEDTSHVLDFNNPTRPVKTFGANISELLADSFFIDNSLIGDFAFNKIQKTIEWLNKKDDLDETEYHQKFIFIVDEPIVQRKLAEMYDEKMKTKIQIEVIDDQIRKLQELRGKIE